jgi:hypothetical protein
MKLPIHLILSILIGSMVCSCQQSRRSERIAALPMNQRALVEQRQIAVGFSADTVLLTWGKPSHVTQRTANGQSLEDWHFDRRKAAQHPERLTTRMSTSGRRGWAQATLVDWITVPGPVVTLANGKVVKIAGPQG